MVPEQNKKRMPLMMMANILIISKKVLEKSKRWIFFLVKNGRLGIENIIFRFKKLPKHLQSGMSIMVALFFLFWVFFLWNLTPVRFGAKEDRIFSVPYGASLRLVGERLRQNGLIRNRTVFEIYVRLNPKQRMAKAGYYRLSNGMSVPRIVRELRRGIPPTVRITIPEGLTIKETAELLAQKGLVNQERFIEQAKDLTMVNEILGDFRLNTIPEGYLFPDTYHFELTHTSEKDIIRKMLSRFKEVFEQNFKDFPTAKSHEIVIVASLIEEEAKKAEERPIIAGVFYNRLRLGYPLQSCATVQYALGKHKERLLYKDLEVLSPYNTYIHQGLPPGPIANPGLQSLKAAVSPAKVSYLYFVAKPDGTHIFSTTYQQHLNAQHRIEKNYVF